jgi:surface protein
LFVALYISTNDGLYYFTTSGVGSPVSGGYYFKDGNIYSFSSGVRSLVNPCAVTPLSTDWVSTIDTRKPTGGGSGYYQIYLEIGAMTVSPYRTPYTIFWGDGSSSDHISSTRHTYQTAGIYTIVVRGPFENKHISFFADNEKLLTIEQWGSFRFLAPESQFYAATSLDLSGVIGVPYIGGSSLKFAFRSCYNLTTINNIEQWDVSGVQNMEQMFVDCTRFNQDLSAWDVSNVTNCRYFDLYDTNWVLARPNFTSCTI